MANKFFSKALADAVGASAPPRLASHAEALIALGGRGVLEVPRSASAARNASPVDIAPTRGRLSSAFVCYSIMYFHIAKALRPIPPTLNKFTSTTTSTTKTMGGNDDHDGDENKDDDDDDYDDDDDDDDDGDDYDGDR